MLFTGGREEPSGLKEPTAGAGDGRRWERVPRACGTKAMPQRSERGAACPVAFSEQGDLWAACEEDGTGDICPAALSSVCPSQVIKELQDFYTDTYTKLKSKDEPQRETLKAIHYAVCGLQTPPAPPSMGTRAPAVPDQCVSSPVVFFICFSYTRPCPSLCS